MYFFIFILGASIGSFLNVLIDRLPKEQSIMGRSHCDYCKKTLSGWDLIPIISFFLLNGKCRYCKKKLSWQYPFIELITGILFVGILSFRLLDPSTEFTLSLSNVLGMIAMLGIISCLIIIFLADAKYQMIPDSMQVTFLIFSIIYHLSSMISSSEWLRFVTSGLIVMLPILFLFLITKGRGMGFGDVKFAFTMGFLLGTMGGLLGLYISFIIGALWGLLLIVLKKKKLKSKIAFGPFLVIGVSIMLFYGREITGFVTKMYGV